MTVNASDQTPAGTHPGDAGFRPTLLIQAETAKMLGICVRSLYTLRQRGLLAATSVLSRVRYDLRDVVAYIDRCRATSLPALAGVEGGGV